MSNWDEEVKLEDCDASYFMRGLKTLWGLFGDYKKAVLSVLVWMIFLEALGFVFPLILKLIFDEIPNLVATGQFNSYVIWLIVAMIVIEMGGLYLDRFALEWRFLRLIIALEHFWLKQAHKKLLELSLTYHERENTGKKISKINRGCQNSIDAVCDLRWNFLPKLLYLVLNVVFIFAIDWRLGLIFMIPFFPAAWLKLRCAKKLAPVWEVFEAKSEESSGYFCQSVVNITTVQNCVQEKGEENRFSSIRKYMQSIDLKASREELFYSYGVVLILRVFFVVTMVAGVYFVLQGKSSIGTLVFVLATGNVTFNSLWDILHSFLEISRKMVAVTRMKKLMQEDEKVKNSKDARIPEKFIGNFEMKKVVFSYPGKSNPVLRGVDIKIDPGQMVAFIGKSGEGKTTAIRLICRMYDIEQGEILLDGMNIKQIDRDWYRSKFAIVQQDVDIFDASIAENIRYACAEATDEQVKEALRAAYLYDILENKNRFAEGIDTQVGERGVRLSGGEKQRVGIARAYLALLKGAKVLILDEATSSLDSRAERAIQEMIDKLRKERSISILAIAHRLSTIKNSDMIYVINNGLIAEKGDHQRLMKRNGLYSELVELQNIGEIDG